MICICKAGKKNNQKILYKVVDNNTPQILIRMRIKPVMELDNKYLIILGKEIIRRILVTLK